MLKITARHIGQALAMLWAAFWVFFVMASELAEPVSPGSKALVCLVGIVFFLGSALVPWRMVRVGGALLLAEGIVFGIANFIYLNNPPATQVFLLLTLALPPLLAGILFLTARPRPSSQPG